MEATIESCLNNCPLRYTGPVSIYFLVFFLGGLAFTGAFGLQAISNSLVRVKQTMTSYPILEKLSSVDWEISLWHPQKPACLKIQRKYALFWREPRLKIHS